MLFGGKELSRFLNRSKRFSRIFPQYRKFLNIAYFIESLFTKDQQQFLSLKWGDEFIDFKTQLLICFEERYNAWNFSFEDLKAKSEAIFREYWFLFKTNLEPKQIRTILLREFLEATSLGSQCFKYKRFLANPFNRFFRIKSKDFESKAITNFIECTYDNLPDRIEVINGRSYAIPFYQDFLGPGYYLYFENNGIKWLWIPELLRKLKWLLEQLRFCEGESGNRYKERLYRETNLCIGLGKNFSSLSWKLAFKEGKLAAYNRHNIDSAEENVNPLLHELVDFILGFFTQEEAESLGKQDVENNFWSLKEQLLHKYCSGYLSFASPFELKVCLTNLISQYLNLFRQTQNKEKVLEIMFEEIDKVVFIERHVDSWNREMFLNLNNPKSARISGGVEWAIEQICKLIGYWNEGEIYVWLSGKERNLKTMLRARWERAWLAQGKREFMRKLLRTHTKYELDSVVTRVDLQAFLGEMDSCFLFPNKKRFCNWVKRKDGTEDVLKLRKNMSDISVSFFRNTTIAIVLLIMFNLLILII